MVLRCIVLHCIASHRIEYCFYSLIVQEELEGALQKEIEEWKKMHFPSTMMGSKNLKRAKAVWYDMVWYVQPTY